MFDIQQGEKIKKVKINGITFYISNYGRIFNDKKKELKPYFTQSSKVEKFARVDITRFKNGKKIGRVNLSIPRLVYKNFIDNNLEESCHVIFKDKNHRNNRWDNLDIGMMRKKYNYPLPQKMKELFESDDTIRLIKSALLTRISPN